MGCIPGKRSEDMLREGILREKGFISRPPACIGRMDGIFRL